MRQSFDVKLICIMIPWAPPSLNLHGKILLYDTIKKFEVSYSFPESTEWFPIKSYVNIQCRGYYVNHIIVNGSFGCFGDPREKVLVGNCSSYSLGMS